MNDASYKRLLSHRRIIKDLFLGFIAPPRPPGWAGSLIFDSLREGPAEHVTDDLRRRLSDVVWSIDRHIAGGRVQTMHLLIEHQSSVDHSMPLRFLNYGSLHYQRRYRDHRWRKGDTADPAVQRQHPLERSPVAGGVGADEPGRRRSGAACAELRRG